MFRVVVGKWIGFGAPYFVKPFLKRASTKGKLGTRGEFHQCCRCNSLWAADQNARNASVEIGGSADGIFVETDRPADNFFA